MPRYLRDLATHRRSISPQRFIAICGTSLLLTCLALSAQAFNTAAYFPLTSGATWQTVKNSTTTENSRVAGTGTINGAAVTIVTSDTGEQEYYSNDALGVRLHGGVDPSFDGPNGPTTASLTFTPPALSMPAEATLGVSTQQSLSLLMFVSGFGNIPMIGQRVITPLSFEDIFVSPIGTFRNALKVHRVTTLSGNLTIKGASATFRLVTDESLWLVRGLGPVKNVDTGTTTVSVSGAAPSTETEVKTHELVDSNLIPKLQPIVFTNQSISEVIPNSYAVFGPFTVNGITVPVPISTTLGEYSINGAPFTATAGMVAPGDSVTVRVRTAGALGNSFDFFVIIGYQDVPLSIENFPNSPRFLSGAYHFPFTVSNSHVPLAKPVAFVPVNGAIPGSIVVSNPAIVNSVSPVPITIMRGEYSIDGAPFTAVDGIANPGQQITLRTQASATTNAVTDTVVFIGGRSGRFVVGTSFSTSVESQFYMDCTDPPGGQSILIKDLSNEFAGTAVGFSQIRIAIGTSNIFAIRLGPPTPTLITPGLYLNAGPPNSSGTVGVGPPNGFPILDASALVSGGGCAALGGRFNVLDAAYDGQGNPTRLAANFESRNGGGGPPTAGQIRFHSNIPINIATSFPPNPFAFTSINNAPFFTEVISQPVTFSDIVMSQSISITNGKYSINGGPFTAITTAIGPDDFVAVSVVTGGDSAGQSCATLTVGGVSAPFCATTSTFVSPPPFSFTALSNTAFSQLAFSNPFTVSASSTLPISISNGMFSVNGGPYQSTGRTVVNGDQVIVRFQTSSASATQSCATFTIGGTPGQFCATTATYTTPNPKTILPLILDD